LENPLQLKSIKSVFSVLICVVFIGLVLSRPAYAHHSFAMFDKNVTATLKGKISKFQWTNPHVFVVIDVADEAGKFVRYTLEGSSPNLLSHSGWNRKTMKVGDVVSVNYHPLRSGETGGMLLTVTLPSGTEMSAW
jgi:hypothetical protein